jgi:hypothetical protein
MNAAGVSVTTITGSDLIDTLVGDASQQFLAVVEMISSQAVVVTIQLPVAMVMM